MREIKFRGKREDNGEWVYGYYVRHAKLRLSLILNISDKKVYRVIPKTVGQYIEMTDMRGKEMFDRDIIRLYHPNGKIFSEVPIAYIFYHRGAWRISGFEKFPFMPNTISSSALKYEVIGNVYDNPELLKEEVEK